MILYDGNFFHWKPLKKNRGHPFSSSSGLYSIMFHPLTTHAAGRNCLNLSPIVIIYIGFGASSAEWCRSNFLFIFLIPVRCHVQWTQWSTIADCHACLSDEMNWKNFISSFTSTLHLLLIKLPTLSSYLNWSIWITCLSLERKNIVKMWLSFTKIITKQSR